MENKIEIAMLFTGYKVLLPPEHQEKKQETFCNFFDRRSTVLAIT